MRKVIGTPDLSAADHRNSASEVWTFFFFLSLSFKKCSSVPVITCVMGMCDDPPQYISVEFIQSQ